MSGLLILGASRSGTSMTAGLFAQHGVCFGVCNGATQYNAKGYFENHWMKRAFRQGSAGPDFERAWLDQLRIEGWDGQSPWGAKCGAERWDTHWRHVGDIAAIVLCYRPRAQIVASRRNVGWNPTRRAIDFNWQIMDGLLRTERQRCFPVWTDRIVDGDFSALRPAFSALGLSLDESIARDWVDPKLWNYGETA